MRTSAAFFAFAIAAQILAGLPAWAEDQAKLTCPAGYSLVVGVCISDADGDVVLAQNSSQSRTQAAQAQSRHQ